jgi:hypothetical protein
VARVTERRPVELYRTRDAALAVKPRAAAAGSEIRQPRAPVSGAQELIAQRGPGRLVWRDGQADRAARVAVQMRGLRDSCCAIIMVDADALVGIGIDDDEALVGCRHGMDSVSVHVRILFRR